MRTMTRNFYRAGTNAVRIALAFGGIYWLKQAMVLPGMVPWAIAVMSFLIASRDACEIRGCLLSAASFYVLAYGMTEMGTEHLWVGYAVGVRYFLGFSLAFTVVYHFMISFFVPFYTSVVKRIHP